MAKLSVRRFLSGILGRNDELQAVKTRSRSRMNLERLEARDVPSRSIPLNGVTWTEVGPRPILQGESQGRLNSTGRFDSVTVPLLGPGVTAGNNHIYAASAVGGIWTSTNKGTSWTPRTDILTMDNPINSATLIRAVQRTNAVAGTTTDDTVYALSSSGGVGFFYFSTNSGQTFTRMGVGAFNGRTINEFVVIPGATQAQDIIFAAVQSNSTNPMVAAMSPSGIYRSIDGGANWVNITANGFPFAQVNILRFSDVDVDPTNLEIVYASVNADTSSQSAVGVYRCTNALTTPATAMSPANWVLRLGGSSEFSGTLPGRLQTSVSPVLPSSLFVSVAAGGIYGVYRSDDTGINWEAFLTPGFSSGNGDLPDYGTASGAGLGNTYSRILVDPRSPLNPDAQILYAAGAGDFDAQVVMSTDSGDTWTNLAVDVDGNGPYFGVRDMVFDRQGRITLATEGGIYNFGPDPTDPNTLIWSSLNGGNNTGINNKATGTGALGTVQVSPFGQALHPTDPDQAYINSSPFHSAARFNGIGPSAYGWQTNDSKTDAWFHINPVPIPHISEQAGAANVLWDFNNPNTMLRVASGGVRRTVDGGVTWDFANVPFNTPGSFVANPSFSNRYFSTQAQDDVYVYDAALDATATIEAFLGFRLPSLDFSPAGGNPGTVTAIGVSRQSNFLYVATTPGIYDSEILMDAMGNPLPVPPPRTRLFVIQYSDGAQTGIFNNAGAPQFDWIELSLPVAVSGGLTNPQMPAPDIINQIIVDPNNPFSVYFKTQNAQTIYNMRSTSINWMPPPPPPAGTTPMGPDPRAAIATVNWQQINPTTGGSMPPQVLNAASTGVTVMTLDPNVGTNANDDTLYIGTNYGVYSLAINPTQTTNFVWQRVGGSELPNNAVRDLDINTTSGVLSVGLNGRGVWQFQIRTLVQGQVFNDLDGDGNFDSGEPAISGRIIRLVDTITSSVIATTTTDAQGFYFFRSVPAGTYTVQEIGIPANEVITSGPVPAFTVTLRDVVLGSGTAAPGTQIIPQLNFGNFVRGSISGVVFNDANQNSVFDPGEVGLQGFVVYIDANTNGVLNWTDGNGNSTWDLGEGEQWTTSTVTGNYSLTNIEPPTIGGLPNPNYQGVVGALVPTFIVRQVNQPSFTQTLPTIANNFEYTVQVQSGATPFGRNFGNFRVGTISGLKFLDANSNGRLDLGENGIPNWQFYIDANSNNIFDGGEINVLTDASGQFRFDSLVAGTYRIREVQQAGFVQTTPNPADVVLTGSNSIAGLLFGNVTLANFRLLSNWTPIGPAPQLNGSGIGNPTVSGRVNSISVDPTNPNRYFIATAGGGIWRTTTGGIGPNAWVPLTDNIAGLSVFQSSPYTDSVAIAPSDPNTVYAALGESPGGTPGHGIIRSTDGGTTWTLLQGPGGAFDFSVVPQLIVGRTDKNLVFAAINGAFTRGVWRTTDGGNTWSSLTDGDPLVAGNYFSDIQVDPFNPNVVYAAIGAPGGGVPNGIYRTSNALSASPSWTLLIGGSAFVPGSLPGNIRLALAPSQPSTIYAAIARASDADGKSRYLATYKTTDSGVNWTNLVNAPDYMGTQGDYDLAITVSPTNPNVVVASGVGTGQEQSTNLVVVSNNGGTTWRDAIAGSGATLGPHTDTHALIFDKSGRLLIGTDGGMFRMNNATLPAPALIPPFGGAIPNWVSLNGALNVPGALNTIQFVGIATHPTDQNKVAGGSQDNGLALFNGNIAWNSVAGGDRGETIWDFDRPNNLYNIAPIASVGANNYVSKSTDGGLTWADATNGITGQTQQNTLFYPPMIIDPNNSMRLFTGTDKVWVTDDGANNWSQTTKYDNVVDVTIPDTPLSGMMPPIPIAAIGVTRVPDTVVFVSQGGSLFRIQLFFPIPTPPAIEDWVDVTPPPGGVSQIIMDPANPGTVYVVAGGTVWRTLNYGGSWSLMDGPFGDPDRLPGVGTNALALDPRIATDPNDDILYAGTENGVFALFNPNAVGKIWYRVGDQNLPNTSVRDLDLNTTTGILSAGTYGRGVWQTRIRGRIEGKVFEDTNGNGKFDNGEPAQAGITVRLLDATPGGSFGAEIATTITDALGNYDFHSLRAGNYRVVQVPPSGQVQTTANPNDLLSFTEQSLATPSFAGTITPGIVVDGNLVFGNFRTGTISGVKFDDRNNNGIRDTGEPGFAGFVIFSDLNGDGIRQWTDGNSNGTFDPGEGETWTTTAADGSYTLTGFGPPVVMGVPTSPPPFFIREIQQTNFTQTSANPAGITLSSGQVVTGINFGNIRNGRLSGAIFDDLTGNGVRDAGDPGVPNRTVNLIDTATGSIIRTVTSDTSGNYVFFSLPAGTYEVREVVPAGWIQTFPVAPNPTFYTRTIAANDQLGNLVFGNFKLFIVSGVKFEDLNGNGTRQSGEAGVPGFTIRLTNTGTGVVLTTVTDAFGNYSFPNIGPGNYTIAEVQKTGWTQTSALPAGFQGISGTDRSGRDFGNFRFITATGIVFNDVNGNGIRDVGEVGIGGITMRLDRGNDGVIDATALTDANGAYSFPTLGPGSYTVSSQPKNGLIVTTPTSGKYEFTATSSINPTGLDFGLRSAAVLAVGQDAGNVPLVSVRNPLTKQEIFSFLAYTGGFKGGVRVATGHVLNQPTPQIVTAPGPGGGPHVRVWNSQTGQEEYGFFAFDSRFTGGVFVAVGDVNGDGFDDIVTAADAGGGPHVRVWSGQNRQELYGFFAYGAGFTGGVRVAVADVNGDGKGDIITGAGPGGGPHIKVFDGVTRATIHSFFGFDGGFRGGVYVAGGDFNNDGKADIVYSAGAGGGPHVRIADGTNLAILAQTYAFEASYTGGVRVAVRDTNFDNKPDVVVGPGPGRKPEVSDYDINNGFFVKRSTVMAFDPSFLGGVFVG